MYVIGESQQRKERIKEKPDAAAVCPYGTASAKADILLICVKKRTTKERLVDEGLFLQVPETKANAGVQGKIKAHLCYAFMHRHAVSGGGHGIIRLGRIYE